MCLWLYSVLSVARLVPPLLQIHSIYKACKSVYQATPYAKKRVGCTQLKFFTQWIAMVSILFGCLFEDW